MMEIEMDKSAVTYSAVINACAKWSLHWPRLREKTEVKMDRSTVAGITGIIA